jgi:drug/metabolite transporter (DMT)-like permease
MNARYKAHLAIFVSHVLFAGNYIASKELMPHTLTPVSLTAWRIAGASLLFFIVGFFQREKIERGDIFKLSICGLIGVTMNQFLFLLALSYTSPIDASIIVTVNPVVVLLLSVIILREKITGNKVFGIIIGASGALLLIVTSGFDKMGSGSWIGNLILFVNTIGYSVYLILIKPLMGKYKATTVMKWVFLFGLLTFLPFGYKGFITINFSIISGLHWAILAYVVIGATFLAFLMNMYGLKFVKPLTNSIYIYFIPVITTLLAILLGRDKPTIIDFISAALVFFGVFLVSRENRGLRFRNKKVQ